MNKKKALAMAVLSAVASIGFVMSASAETMSTEMSPVLVEGQRDKALAGQMANASGSVGIMGERDVMETPFSTVNVSEKTLDLYAGPNEPLDKALVGVPSVRQAGSVLHGDFTIRGFRTNGNCFYVNGVNGMMTQFNLPIFAMEGIDVVSGPNSMLGTTMVKYEGDTAGGILNFRSKKAGSENFIKYKQTFSGKGSFGEYLDVSQRVGKNKEWGVRLNTELLNGETSVKNTDMKAKGIALNVDHKGNKSKTNFFATYRDLDIYKGVRWFKLGPGVTKMPKAIDGSKDLSAQGTHKAGYGWFMTLNHEQKMNDNWKLFANAGYTRQLLDQNNSPASSSYIIDDNDGNYKLKSTNSITPQRSYYIQMGTDNKFKTGAVKHNVIASVDKAWRNRETGLSTVKPSGTDTFGTGNIYTGILNQTGPVDMYVSGSRHNNRTSVWGASILDSVDYNKWSAMLGIHRHVGTARSYKVGNVYSATPVTSSANCPTYSLSYKPNDKVILYGNHAEYFDVGQRVTNSGSKVYENVNDIISPAKTKQNEIGVKYLNKGLLTTLAYYDIKQANNIDVTEGGKLFLRQDGEVRHKGVELSLNGKLARKWSGMVGIAYMNAKYQHTAKGAKDGVQESGQPKWTGSAAIEYAPDDKFSTIFRATYTGTNPFYNTNSSQHFNAPSYMVYDLGVTYNTKISKVPVKLSAMCYNLFNKDYWMVSRGDQIYASTPRTLFVSAEFKL